MLPRFHRTARTSVTLLGTMRHGGAFHTATMLTQWILMHYCPIGRWQSHDGHALPTPDSMVSSTASSYRVQHKYTERKEHRAMTGTRRGACAAVQLSLRAVVRSSTACLPSPNIINVLSMANKGLGSPAKPGDSERFTTTTVRALSTLRMGMP